MHENTLLRNFTLKDAPDCSDDASKRGTVFWITESQSDLTGFKNPVRSELFYPRIAASEVIKNVANQGLPLAAANIETYCSAEKVKCFITCFSAIVIRQRQPEVRNIKTGTK